MICMKTLMYLKIDIYNGFSLMLNCNIANETQAMKVLQNVEKSKILQIQVCF